MTDEQRDAMTELMKRMDAGDLWPDDAMLIPKGAGIIIEAALVTDEGFADFVGAYDDSVDDALALLAHLLPDATWSISGGASEGYFAAIQGSNGAGAHPTSPARALLIATLKAKLGEAE